MNKARAPILFGIALALAASAAACGGSDDVAGGGGDAGVEGGRASELRQGLRLDAADSGSAAYATEAGSGPGFKAAQLPTIQPYIIKTGDVRLEIKGDGLQRSINDAVALATRHGGYVVSTMIDDASAGSGTLVVRVPSENFERALNDVRELGDVESESVTGKDVSQEFVDLEARLRNWSAQEAVLLRLMDRAETISSSIRVQSELQGVQLEIERLRGRLNYLDDQTATSTISMSFLEVGAAATKQNTVQRAVELAVNVALGIVSALIIAIGALIPIAVLALIGLLVFRGLKPRLTT